jgi:hypothetical protein
MEAIGCLTTERQTTGAKRAQRFATDGPAAAGGMIKRVAAHFGYGASGHWTAVATGARVKEVGK